MKKIDPELTRLLAWLAIALYVAALGISAVMRVQGDFNAYYRTGILAAKGADVYDRSYGLGFLYAPVLAMFFVPFGMMPLKVAQAVWFALSAAALLAMIFGSSRLIFKGRRQLPGGLVLLPILLSTHFIDNNIEHGQINIIAFALIVWALVLADEDRAASAGLLLGAALMIKPFALLGALYLLLRRRLDALGWAIVAAIALTLIPVLLFGPAGAVRETISYIHAVSSMAGRYRMRLTNQSAVSAVARVIDYRGDSEAPGSALSLYLGTGIELTLVAAVSYWILISSSDADGRGDQLALCALFCLMASFAPVSWKHYYVVLIIPYMALLSALWIDKPLDEEPSPTAWVLFVLSIVLDIETSRPWRHVLLFYSAHFVASLMVIGSLFALWRAQQVQALRGSDAGHLPERALAGR